MFDPIPGNYNSSMRVTSHPVQDGRQFAAEVRIREGGVEVLSMSPDAARALADALRDAADHAEGVQ